MLRTEIGVDFSLSKAAKNDYEPKRKGLAMKRSVFHVALGLAAFIAAHAVQATQSVFPASDAGGTAFPSNTVTRGAGQQLVFFGRYVITSPTSPNESGLGLKIAYDANKITNVAIDPVVTMTKCMVFTPNVLVNGATSQVLFGWADTSQRTGGAVGWPATSDAISGSVTASCINPQGIVTTTGGFGLPLTLFRFTATIAAGFTSGSTPIDITSPSASSAGGSSSFTNTTLTVNGAVAPPISFVSASTRKTHGAAGDFDIPIDPAGSMTAGTTITVEPRQIGAGFKIVFLFNTAPTSATVMTSSGSGAATFAGNEATVTLTGVSDATRVQVDLSLVNGLVGVGGTAIVGFLLGDTNGSRGTTGSDVSIVKSKSGLVTDATNFKSDLNASGGVSGSDVSIVKSRSGLALP